MNAVFSYETNALHIVINSIFVPFLPLFLLCDTFRNLEIGFPEGIIVASL